MLWWLILHVNLTGLLDAHNVGELLLLDVSVWVFLSLTSAEWGKSSFTNTDRIHTAPWESEVKSWTKGKFGACVSGIIDQ